MGGGIPPRPSERQRPSPPPCSSEQSNTKKFSFPFSEKIGRAQNQKSRENFFAGWQVVASGGGLASLVWFRSGISDKMSSSQIVKTHQTILLALKARRSRAPQARVKAKTLVA
ncbi:MAG: hypothetical protein HZB11_01080 [Candidatus Yonathbacteria bacterium]|nr:hypothetical protein [Candidatus Yonathbacteria bacterium]